MYNLQSRILKIPMLSPRECRRNPCKHETVGWSSWESLARQEQNDKWCFPSSSTVIDNLPKVWTIKNHGLNGKLSTIRDKRAKLCWYVDIYIWCCHALDFYSISWNFESREAHPTRSKNPKNSIQWQMTNSTILWRTPRRSDKRFFSRTKDRRRRIGSVCDCFHRCVFVDSQLAHCSRVPMMHVACCNSARQHSSQQAQQATSTIHWKKRSTKTLFLPALGNARSGLKYLERNAYQHDCDAQGRRNSPKASSSRVYHGGD